MTSTSDRHRCAEGGEVLKRPFGGALQLDCRIGVALGCVAADSDRVAEAATEGWREFNRDRLRMFCFKRRGTRTGDNAKDRGRARYSSISRCASTRTGTNRTLPRFPLTRKCSRPCRLCISSYTQAAELSRRMP
jgi:hypothetical protein